MCQYIVVVIFFHIHFMLMFNYHTVYFIVYLFIVYSVINIIIIMFINIIKYRKTDILLVVYIKPSGHDTLSPIDTTAFRENLLHPSSHPARILIFTYQTVDHNFNG
jgi:hypothetical protein